MVIPGVISSTTGRYGPTNVSGTFRNQALMIHRAGGGVVDARGLLRGVGFRFSNAALTQMFREFNEAAAKAVGVNSIRDDFRPTQRTITQTGMRFKTRYQYSGIARLRDLETGITADIRVQFGDQRLLTGREMRERIQAIGEAVGLKGGPGYDMERPDVDTTTITGVFQSA